MSHSFHEESFDGSVKNETGQRFSLQCFVNILGETGRESACRVSIYYTSHILIVSIKQRSGVSVDLCMSVTALFLLPQ